MVNPQTGEPITKTTLARAFKRELTNGKAKLKSLVATRFYEACAAAMRGPCKWA